MSRQGKPPVAPIDGLTDDQRLFLAWARVWAANVRPEFAKLLMNTNPHPLDAVSRDRTAVDPARVREGVRLQVGRPDGPQGPVPDLVSGRGVAVEDASRILRSSSDALRGALLADAGVGLLDDGGHDALPDDSRRPGLARRTPRRLRRARGGPGRRTRASTASRSGSRRSDGTSSRPVTFADQSSDTPRWSPDGRSIAFVSKRDDRFANVWILSGRRRRGVAPDRREVRRLAGRPGLPTDARSRSSLRSRIPDKERREKDKDDARVVGSDERPAPPLAHRGAGRSRAGPASAPAPAPDGRLDRRARLVPGRKDDRLLPSSARRPPTTWPSSDISLVDVETGTSRRWPRRGAAETEPSYSPDGKWIAYVVTDDPPRWAHRRWIRLAPAGRRRRPRPGAHSFDEDPGDRGLVGRRRDALLSPRRRASTTSSTRSTSRPGSCARSRLPAPSSNGAHVNARGTWIGFVRQSPDRSVEAFASSLDSPSPRSGSRA